MDLTKIEALLDGLSPGELRALERAAADRVKSDFGKASYAWHAEMALAEAEQKAVQARIAALDAERAQVEVALPAELRLFAGPVDCYGLRWRYEFHGGDAELLAALNGVGDYRADVALRTAPPELRARVLAIQTDMAAVDAKIDALEKRRPRPLD